MKIGLSITRKIKVYDDVDGEDIDTSCEDVRADEATRLTILEIMIDPISILLLHFGVDVEARITHLSDLLGKQLYSLRVLTENDGLINVELRKKCIQTVDFLFFLKVCIVLGNTFQCQLVHQVDKLGFWHVLFLETFDGDWVCGREERNLLLRWH